MIVVDKNVVPAVTSANFLPPWLGDSVSGDGQP